MTDATDSYVAAALFFEKEFPSCFKQLKYNRGFIGKRTIVDHDYYFICTIKNPIGPVHMLAFSDNPVVPSARDLYERIALTNTFEKRASIKLNASGEWYAHCIYEILSAPISEKALQMMCSECLCALFTFEQQFDKESGAKEAPAKRDGETSSFPFCLSAWKAFYDEKQLDPWSVAEPCTDPHMERMLWIHEMNIHDQVEKMRYQMNAKTSEEETPDPDG